MRDWRARYLFADLRFRVSALSHAINCIKSSWLHYVVVFINVRDWLDCGRLPDLSAEFYYRWCWICLWGGSLEPRSDDPGSTGCSVLYHHGKKLKRNNRKVSMGKNQHFVQNNTRPQNLYLQKRQTFCEYRFRGRVFVYILLHVLHFRLKFYISANYY